MSDKKLKLKNFIEYTPEIVIFLNEDQTKLATKYNVIFKSLREKKYLTAKEIHDLYVDEETNKYTCTIKTIYRYLERLENEGLIKIAGHRMTEGQHLTEKLYTRTANIFFKADKEKILPEAIQYQKDRIKDIYTLLSEVEGMHSINYSDFEALMLKKHNLKLELNRNLIAKIPSNEKLANLFSSIDIDAVNYVSETTADLLVYIKNPELFKQLQNILKK